ncbi:hypothetical protein ASE88_04325 [Sphingomonas sp. Leaf38]|nr:hypothetical protein ASE88_04325 [Sphingomonas sp. Leaf38]
MIAINRAKKGDRFLWFTLHAHCTSHGVAELIDLTLVPSGADESNSALAEVISCNIVVTLTKKVRKYCGKSNCRFKLYCVPVIAILYYSTLNQGARIGNLIRFAKRVGASFTSRTLSHFPRQPIFSKIELKCQTIDMATPFRCHSVAHDIKNYARYDQRLRSGSRLTSFDARDLRCLN